MALQKELWIRVNTNFSEYISQKLPVQIHLSVIPIQIPLNSVISERYSKECNAKMIKFGLKSMYLLVKVMYFM